MSAQFTHFQEAPKREERARGRRSEGEPAGYVDRNCCALCTFARSQAHLFNRPAREFPTFPFKRNDRFAIEGIFSPAVDGIHQRETTHKRV